MIRPETKFLIASNNEKEARFIQSVLAEQGFPNVAWAATAEDATRVLALPVCDIFIAAWELPDQGALRLVREVRGQAHTLRTPCFLIVNSSSESDRKLAEAAGAAAFLVRPLTRAGLMERLRDVLSRRLETGFPDSLESVGDVLSEKQNPELALSAYQDALSAANRGLAGLHAEMGMVLKQKGRLREALDHLDQAVGFDPHLARAQDALGHIHMDAERWELAADAFERTAALDPGDPETPKHLIKCLIKSGRYRRAEEKLRELLTSMPRDLYFLNRMGIVLRKQGKYDEAVDCYLEAVKITDRDDNLFFNLGRCLYQTNRKERALAALTRAVEINPANQDARKLMNFLQRESDNQ